MEEHWLDLSDGTLGLSGQLRLLLRWAGIDPAIPAQLKNLHALSKAHSDIVDGPSALAWARNRSVHPPKRVKDGKPDWASWEVIYEAWRLALEYTDLVLLSSLGTWANTAANCTSKVDGGVR